MRQVTKETYNHRQNYYFVDYRLEEKGHPEYIQTMKEKDPSHPNSGCPRWVRNPFQTEQDVQETLNYVFEPYPDLIRDLRIRSEEELNDVIRVDEKTGERLWKHDDEESYEKGLKLTIREYDFGNNYQWLYDHTTGVIDNDGKPLTSEIPEGLNLRSRDKIKDKESK